MTKPSSDIGDGQFVYQRTTTQLYRWRWKARLPERHGQLLRVLARGKLNSCLIEFEDGWRVVTSRNALRKA
jgi:hypothetical protein